MSHQEYAFPVHETPDSTDSPGMTLRDYFAAKAMQGLLAQSNGTALGSPVEVAAAYAWAMADAMLAARADSLNSGPKPEQA